MNILPKLSIALILMSSLLLPACSEQGADRSSEVDKRSDTDKNSNKEPATLAENALAQAWDNYNASEQAGFAWVNAKVALNTATWALSEGDFETAIAEANQANSLAESSLAQAAAAQNDWRKHFPKAPAKASSAPNVPEAN